METTASSKTKTVVIGPDRPMVLIGERMNPTGKKRMSNALREGNLELLQQEALAQVQAGARILDVNVGIIEADEDKLMREAIRLVAAATDVPLCIDSSRPETLQAGLEVYEGKALVNSVNGQEERMNTILPLVKKYGAAVIALAEGEEGVPGDPDGRVEIAKKIVSRAEDYGIPRHDIILDPLVMTISANQKVGRVTLDTMRRIRQELGLNMVVGLSNISFGLPNRVAVNAALFYMAAACGLTCVIMDPLSSEVRRAAFLIDLLNGNDPYCKQYLTDYRANR